MDDLISRAAAIDAIVSATAFPDADYIKNLCQNPANSEDWLGGVCDAINAVEDVNAVDAIPVEWMRNLCAIAKMEIDDEMFIDWLIQTWQKEHEVQDG